MIPHLLDLYGMVIIIAVHMMHFLQCYMKSGPLKFDTKVWTRRFKEINQHHLKSLSVCFKKHMNGQASFETTRDAIRHELHTQNPTQFPYGTRGKIEAI
jgi:hypothetical protein